MTFAAVLSPVTNGVSKDRRWKILMQLPPWYILYRVVFYSADLWLVNFSQEYFFFLTYKGKGKDIVKRLPDTI